MALDGQQQQQQPTVLVTRPAENATTHFTTTPVVPFSAPDPPNNDHQISKLSHLIHKIKQNKRRSLIVLVVILVILIIIFVILAISLWSSYSAEALLKADENLPISESTAIPSSHSVQSNDVFHLGNDENFDDHVTASDIGQRQNSFGSTSNFAPNSAEMTTASVKVARTGDFSSGYFVPSSNFETVGISIITTSVAVSDNSWNTADSFYSRSSITTTVINIRPLLPVNVPRSYAPCDPKWEFRCSDDRCIRKTLRCNKKRDCSNGIDEKNCSCVDYLQTLSPNKICDGYPDCPKYEDEANCSAGCSDNEFRCQINGDCIPISQKCDGKSDCEDDEDETNCWTVSPSLSALYDSRNPHRSNYGYPFWMAVGKWNMICSDVLLADSMADKLCKKSGYESAILNEIRRHDFENISFFLHFRTPSYESVHHKVSYSCPSMNSPYFVCSGFRECGQRPKCQPNRKRIVGGRSTGPDCHPWTVALYKNGQLTCHAVVLTHTWLLTAAHCMAQSLNARWMARLGFYRQHSRAPWEEVRSVVGAVPHPNYTASPLETDDLALLKLDRPVRFGPHVTPPCLPLNRSEGPEPGERCTVVGWGYASEGATHPVDELRSVDLVALSLDECNDTGPFRGQIKPCHLCFNGGYEKKDACQGDSGGPLLCRRKSDGTLYLAGVTSAGYGCARPGAPSLWTRISCYLDWIHDVIGGEEANNSKNTSVIQSIVPPPCIGFLCRYGDCIYEQFRCDSVWNCKLDGDDEINCDNDGISSADTTGIPLTIALQPAPTCLPQELPCSSDNSCLPAYKFCDYIADCSNGEDEEICNCHKNDSKCRNRKSCALNLTTTTPFLLQTAKKRRLIASARPSFGPILLKIAHIFLLEYFCGLENSNFL